MYRRYAIYFTPDGALAETGAAWLGWDIARGHLVAHPQLEGLDLAAITKRPRKYGLHATIKPPMALADGTTSAELVQAAGALAGRLAPVTLGGLRVSLIGRFLALTADGDTRAVRAMAAQVVETLDAFRAPPTPDDLHSRHPKTPSQQRNLVRWGYPHVMEDFHFHITLTGPLKNPAAILPKVDAHFRSFLAGPLGITHLTVVGEDANGMFHTLKRLPLGG